MKLDFYASEQHYFDHIVPIWGLLPKEFRGTFYVSEKIKSSHNDIIVGKPNDNITLVSSYSDYLLTKGKVIYMEHGIGNTYSNESPYYAGGIGKDRVVLFLNNHVLTHNKNKKAYPNAKHIIIGTPKSDSIKEKSMSNNIYTICFSFHWECQVSPETMSAFDFYKNHVVYLSKQKEFNLIFHGHPKDDNKWNEFCKINSIKRVKSFEEVINVADLYICDNSSTIYEFILTGKPVIVLNAPWYRKSVNHGIRFWSYIPGPQINNPSDLFSMIIEMLKNPKYWIEERNNIIKVLYPHLGNSSNITTNEIIKFLKET